MKATDYRSLVWGIVAMAAEWADLPVMTMLKSVRFLKIIYLFIFIYTVVVV